MGAAEISQFLTWLVLSRDEVGVILKPADRYRTAVCVLGDIATVAFRSLVRATNT
jgi:hypothetical protein